MATNEQPYRFFDGDAYDRYMGVWSRAACPRFLEWLAAPRGARWLDVGCGTGVLTAAILDSPGPASIAAIDPATAQVETARRHLASPLVEFAVADACDLPQSNESIDVVASSLVVNFIADRAKALAEMRRVARPGALVAGFVWEFATERAPAGPVRRALTAAGATVATVPGSADSTLDGFARLFEAAGFGDIETFAFDVERRFESPDAYWTMQTTGYAPSAAVVKKMTPEAVGRAKALLLRELHIDPDGSVTCSARANAVKARKR